MFERLIAIPRAFYTPDQKRLSLLAYMFLILLCCAFFTPGIVTMPATDRDESSFAQASKQMIETGNYTDIRLQDQPRYKKPIGIYWLQSAAVRLLNPQHLNEIWAYRIPSLAGATVAVLMTAALGALLFSPRAGLLAAMMMAGCVLLNVEARLAKTDATLLACIMVMQYALARAYLGRKSEERREKNESKKEIEEDKIKFSSLSSPLLSSLLLSLSFWTALAAGILVKGPIILLPLASTLVWLRLSDKTLSWFRTLRPLPGLIYALCLIMPWFIAISMQSHGAFMQQSAGQDMLAKLWQGQNRGILPPGMHLMALPILFFPFALFVVLAAPDMWKNRKENAVKFCLGWIIPTWIVFEISFTKLPHYVLPAYPAIALLTAKFMCDGFPSAAATKRRLSIVLVIALWLMIGAGFATAFAFLPAFVDHMWSPAQIAVGILLFLAQGAALLCLPTDKTASMVVLTLGTLLFMTTTFGDTVPNLRHMWMSREIIEAVDLQPSTCPSSKIIATGYHEPSLVFLSGTDTLFPANGPEAARDLKENPCRVAVIDAAHRQAFLDAFKDDKIKLVEAGSIEGLNSGHGAPAALTLYRIATGKP